MMSQRSHDAVVFDLDGVLVDSRAPIAASINYALARHGLGERPERALHRFIGPPLAVAFAELTGEAASSAVVASCVTSYRERYAEASLRETTVFPGITEMLAGLRRDHRLAVATSKARAFAEPLLAALELRHFFDVVAGPGLDARNEDKATTIATALAVLAPERAVMVGDRSFDIVGAHARGLPAIGVTWGIGDREELVATGADAIVDAPADVPRAVHALMHAERFAA
jgi:phosphoglycolate phosphatase